MDRKKHKKTTPQGTGQAQLRAKQLSAAMILSEDDESDYDPESEDKAKEIRRLHDEQMHALEAAKRALTALNRRTMNKFSVGLTLDFAKSMDIVSVFFFIKKKEHSRTFNS